MTVLLLLRHAKAEPARNGDDFDRALTDAGRSDAHRLGRFLHRDGPRPDAALVSPARRTRQTFEAVAAELGGPPLSAVRFDDALFTATASQLRAQIRAATSQACLLVVGHNPAIAELAVDLAGDGDHAERDRLQRRFPPGSLAVLRFGEGGWDAVRSGKGLLQALVLPDDLPAD